MPIPPANSWKPLTIPAAFILLYLAICFAYGVGTAGLQEDEAISFQQSAGLSNHAPMQCLPGFDVRFRGRCLPVMVAPYVGATKDYVLLPMFWIAGFHVGLARMGAALLAALGIFGAWFFIHRFFGATAAAITAGFLAVNPSYIDLPLFDNGNIAFSLGILGCLLTVAALLTERQTHMRYFALGFFIGIGVWGRLNFAWVVLAGGIAVALVARLQILKMLRYLPALIGGALVGAAPLIRFLRSHSEQVQSFMKASAVTQTFQQNLHTVFYSLREVMLASEEHRTTMWHAERISPGLSDSLVVLAIISVGWCCFRRSRPARAVAFAILILVFEYLVSGLPVASHHTVIFVPLVALALGIASSDVLRVRRAGRVAIALFCCAYAVTAAKIDFDAASDLHRTQGYGESSAAIYPLVSFLQSHPDPNGLYMLDWGFAHPVFVLSKGQRNSTNLFRPDGDDAGGGVDWPRLLSDGGTFVTYAIDSLHFPEATIVFQQELKRSGKPFTKTSFRQRDGSPYADVYLVPKSASGEVLRAPAGLETTFIASPAEIVSQTNGLGVTTLLFWTDQSKFVEIHVGAPDGPMLSQFRSLARGTSGVAKTGLWVSDGMTFYLQDVAGKPLTSQNTLATVKVSVRAPK